jgi:glycosyltransferase involved in cell wall biosynthesis
VKILKNSRHIVFTSVNFNYLGRALTLARSVKKHDPDVYFVLLLVEPDMQLDVESKKLLLGCDGGQTFDEILTLSELNFAKSTSLIDYSVVEMCTAVKGVATLNLLSRDYAKFVTYLDPDLCFYGSLEEIRSQHADGEVLLTPHLNHVPFINQVIHNDEIEGALRHGIFNLGFVSFKKSKPSMDIAAWWADRLAISSKADYSRGIFTDQKWWDLSQVYFSDVKVIKKDGWNMAPWNLSERRLASLNPNTLESGDSLLFFHFSKFPSKEFNEKIDIQFKSKLLEELIELYTKDFQDSESYANNLLSKVKKENQSFEYHSLIIPKRSPRIENLITKTIHSSVNNKILRQIVLKNSRIKKLARYLYAKANNLMYRLDKSNNLINSTIFDEISIDILLISHRGGGGVSIVVDERIREFQAKGLKVAILSPGNINGAEVAIPYLNVVARVDQDIQRLLSSCAEIEIHHTFGLERYLNSISENKINRVFLHDKYLISKVPFSDTENYIQVPAGTLGINLPLDGTSHYIESDWQTTTRKLFLNTETIYAPSKYLIDAYLSVFPELTIEKYELESSFQLQSGCLKISQKDSIVLISPTGWHKGSSILIEVARFLEEARPSLHFQVFGDLDIYSLEGLSSLTNVRLFGQISRNRLNHALWNSTRSIGWIPSLTGESYSLALTDFMSNGIPVIAAKTGALPERLSLVPGNYLYDPNTPISDLIKILLALVENKDIEEFSHFIEKT